MGGEDLPKGEEQDAERIVQTDPQDATVEKGRQVFEDTVSMYVKLAREALEEKGLAT